MRRGPWWTYSVGDVVCRSVILTSFQVVGKGTELGTTDPPPARDGEILEWHDSFVSELRRPSLLVATPLGLFGCSVRLDQESTSIGPNRCFSYQEWAVMPAFHFPCCLPSTRKCKTFRMLPRLASKATW